MKSSLVPITIKSQSTQISTKMWRNWKPYTIDDNAKGPASVEDSLAVLNLDLAHDLAIPFLDIFPQRIKDR